MGVSETIGGKSTGNGNEERRVAARVDALMIGNRGEPQSCNPLLSSGTSQPAAMSMSYSELPF